MNLQTYFSKPNTWCQHSLFNSRGERCLIGAMIYIYGDHTQAMMDVKDALHCVIGFYSIEAYNDADGRTITEIQRLVKEANK